MKRLAALVGLLTTACLNLAEERAQRDATIGHGDTVDIANGRAVVRSLADGSITLWAGAPELDATLHAGSRIELHIDNVLADADLVALDETTQVTGRQQRSATELTWVVTSDGETARVGLRVPDAAESAPWRFLMFADVQEAIDRVGDIYAQMNAIADARFVVMAGDLTETGNEEELAKFRESLRELRLPVYVTLGNHELGTRDNPYYRWFGRGSHAFQFRGVQFTFVDTASATVATRTRTMLRTWLDEGYDIAHVAIMHIPPIDPIGARAGSFSSKNEAYGFLSELAAAGVDLTLYGHVHSFYAFANAGIPAFIAGGGGAIPERMDGIGRHFLAVDVDPASQRFEVGLLRVD